MITVEEAWKIIEACKREYGAEMVPVEKALGRVLAEDLQADRDFPPYNRVAMDGIALSFSSFENGNRIFKIKAVQGAGEKAIDITDSGECIEVMTGAVSPASTDTVVRYEDLEIKDGQARILAEHVKKGQNIHTKGKDKKQGEVLVPAGQMVSSSVISLAASVGKAELMVKKLPRMVIVSSGDELVEIHENPLPYQIRSSNDYAIRAVLQPYGASPDMLHIPDDPELSVQKISECIEKYDVILLSGGVSMGKYDYIPQALEKLSVSKLFHKVLQKPGKPFWFGRHGNGALIFAFPGNPVSVFMCVHRYLLPWLNACLGIAQPPMMAELQKDFSFPSSIQFFMLVKLELNEQGKLIAWPLEGNGSGDFVQVAGAHAFMELPLKENIFHKGQLLRVWPFVEVMR
ncbi:MAG: molybdopterin molybdotransferase MoeA [Cytophagaceae bacterium]